jgi:hypothetical protein
MMRWKRPPEFERLKKTTSSSFVLESPANRSGGSHLDSPEADFITGARLDVDGALKL